MEKYNYREAITSDIRYAIECKEVLTPTDYPDRDTAFEAIYDLLWLNDGVTGNASGSYWCNAWKAEDNENED